MNNRKERMNKIKLQIKTLSALTQTRQALENKVQKRRKRRESLALNPNDAEALKQEQQSDDEREGVKHIDTFKESYEMGDKIGQGANGVVRKCNHRQSNKTYAVKCMEMQQQQMLLLKRNFLDMRKLKHPNVVSYRSMFLDMHRKRCYLVMDYEPTPCLEKIHGLTENQIKSIMKQLLETLEYIHSKNICHRDIKPGNILFNRETQKLKIIDFGISKKTMNRGKKLELLTRTGTQYYQAPEMLLGSGYDQRVDLWAAGITLYELIVGKTPFQSAYLAKTVENICKNQLYFDEEVWSFYSPFAHDLVHRLLVKNPKQRLTASEAKKHFWIKNNESQGQLIHSDSFQIRLKKPNGELCVEKEEKSQSIEMGQVRSRSSTHDNDSSDLVIPNLKGFMRKWDPELEADELLVFVDEDGEKSTYKFDELPKTPV